MQSYRYLVEDLKSFIRKEPLYLGLVIFIILINLLTFLSDLQKKTGVNKLPQKISKVERLIQEKDRIESAITEDKKISIIATVVVMGLALLVLMGMLLDVIIFIRKDQKELLERSHSPPPVSWNIWDGLKIIILFIFLGYVIVIIEAILSLAFPSIKSSDRVVSIANATIMDFVSIAIVFYFAIRRYKHKIDSLGLTLKNFFKNIFYGLLGYVSVIPILVAALLVTVFFINLFKYKPTPQPVLEIFLEEEKGSILVYLSIFVAIAGPIMEEIFFRGFLYNAIKKETSVRKAIFISALLFSFLHAHPVGFLPILILGIFLAYLYEKTGSLVSSITVHVIHNLAMVFIIFLIKGVLLR